MATVKVAEISICHLLDCRHSEDLHLLVSWSYVNLDHGNVVAISYTWGEFNRTDSVIGHDADGKKISMQIGEEWDRTEFIMALAGICMSESETLACWLDQLCITQDDDEEVRRTIALIPQIYRSFDVVALMPGRPCACLATMTELARELKNSAVDDLARTSRLGHEVVVVTDRCMNALGISSYFDRVWTRQELMYSSNIRVVWTADEESTECAKNVEELHHLSRFAALKFQSCLILNPDQDTAHAFHNLRVACSSYFQKALQAISEYGGFLYDVGFRGREGMLHFLEFASGSTIYNGRQSQHDNKNVQQRTIDFISQLGRLGSTSRVATKACDYVASVWVDCPGFVLPLQYKKMSLSELLDNAVRQMEAHTGFTLAVNLPSDLATPSSKHASALWQPKTYIDELVITSTDQIYGVLSQPHLPLPIAVDGTLPLLALQPQAAAIGSAASDYLQQLGGKDTAEAFDMMLPVVDSWPLWVLERAIPKSSLQSTNSNLDISRYMFAALLLDSVTAKFGRPGTKRAWVLPDGSRAPDIDHHGVVYELVCMALNLDPQLCKQRCLRLLVRKSHPPCIGLTNRPLDSFYALEDADLLQQRDPRTTKTICMVRGTQVTGSTVVDAVETRDKNGASTYRIVTIWVPQHSTAFHDISAMVDPRGRDGSLGNSAL